MNDSQLWFTSKKLDINDKLYKYIGKNEKTKIIIKISKLKGHMPIREPIIDEETRKKMMSFWHKKQENDKILKEDDDESYLQSQWANPNALKNELHSFQSISIKK